VIRTRALLLRSNPGADAVATSDDAGQVSGGTHCCSPSYLVIASRAAGAVIPTGADSGVSEQVPDRAAWRVDPTAAECAVAASDWGRSAERYQAWVAGTMQASLLPP
jgi:hypothetical protein